MNPLNGKIVALSFVATLAFYAIAYALTTSEIWNTWFDDTNDAIRVYIVANSV